MRLSVLQPAGHSRYLNISIDSESKNYNRLVNYIEKLSNVAKLVQLIKHQI